MGRTYITLSLLLAATLAGLAPRIALAQPGATTRIQITSEPEGAVVYIDGSISRAGETPLTVNLTREEHRIRLVLEGHATEDRTITVGRSRQTLSFRLIPMARLEVTAANDAASGATVRIDGEEVGTVPLTHNIDGGRHEVRVERNGYESFSRWLDVSPGQSYALAVSLRASSSGQGTIIVAGAVNGAPVSIDGQDRGTTPAVVDVPAGEHVVVVSPPGQSAYTETVTVQPGARVTVTPSFGGATASQANGSLRVLTQPTGATVFVDGEEAGTAPVTVEDVVPGSHIVEARAEGYESNTSRITIEPGRRETIQLVLEESEALGTLIVTSEVAGAQVLLDGQPIGSVPVTRDDVPAGSHQVIVRAPDHEDWQQQIQMTAGRELTLRATPQPLERTGFLSVEADAPGAEVLLNGVLIGNAPLADHEVRAGQHRVEVRADGFEPYTRTINVAAGSSQALNARMRAASGGGDDQDGRRADDRDGDDADARDGGDSDDGDDDDDDDRRRRRSDDGGESDDEDEERRNGDDDEEDLERPRFAYSARAIQRWKLALDGSWGWPNFIGNYRLTLGVYRHIDVAIEGRSTLRWHEIDGHVRYGLRLFNFLGLGASLNIGGGWGEYGRSGFVFGLTALQSFDFGRVSIGVREGLRVFSDQYTTVPGAPRDKGARFYIGASLEIQLRQWLHLFAIVDWAPGQEPRRVNCWDQWNYFDDGGDVVDTCPSEHIPGDIAIEGRIGLGFRFF